MKFTLSWLKDHLDTTASLDEICEGLVGVGLEVEEVGAAAHLDAFTVAHVIEAQKHPNADKLRPLRRRDQGWHEAGCLRRTQCARRHQGHHRAARRHNPGDRRRLRPASIRGVESQAMLCSERELLISDEHNGIIELSGDWPVGTPAAVALGLDDPMIYVKVTPNRPDALGVYGIARDLAAKGLGKPETHSRPRRSPAASLRPSRSRSISPMANTGLVRSLSGATSAA